MAPLPLSSISRALGVMGFPGTQIFFLLLFFILPLSFVGDLYQTQQNSLQGIVYVPGSNILIYYFIYLVIYLRWHVCSVVWAYAVLKAGSIKYLFNVSSTSSTGSAVICCLVYLTIHRHIVTNIFDVERDALVISAFAALCPSDSKAKLHSFRVYQSYRFKRSSVYSMSFELRCMWFNRR